MITASRKSILLTVLACTLAIGSSCSLGQTQATAGARAMSEKREDLKKVAVIVKATPIKPVGRSKGAAAVAEDYTSVISTSFEQVLLKRKYDLVTRDSLEAVAGELMRRGDSAFDVSTAAEIGKLAHASHIVVVKMPHLSATPPKKGTVGAERGVGDQYQVQITAQLIEVATGRVLSVAQDGVSGRGKSLADMVRTAAVRTASKLP